MIPGMTYNVSVKNAENTQYKDVKCLKISLVDTDKAVVSDQTIKGQSTSLFTGTVEECSSFIRLMFNYEELDDSDFRIKLYNLRDMTRDIDDKLVKEIYYFLQSLIEKDYLMPMDCDYELEGILRAFLIDAKDEYLADPEDFLFSEKAEELLTRYRELIKVQVKAKFGSVYPIEEFLQAVENGCINDDDGSGNLMDENGDEGPSVWDAIYFDHKENKYQIEMPKDRNYPYVVWYNK
jgi:hypothetical protein